MNAAAEIQPKSVSETCRTQTAIVACLQRHYSRRLRNQIAKDWVSAWLRGKDIPVEGAPPMPHKDGEYFYMDKIYVWFDEWVLPAWMIGSTMPRTVNGSESSGSLTELEQREKREKIEHARFLRQKERGDFVTITAAENIRRSGYRMILNFTQRALEVEATRELTDWVATHFHPPPDLFAAYQEKVVAQQRAITDRIHDELAKAAAAEPEIEAVKI